MSQFLLKDFVPIREQLKDKKATFETFRTSYSKRIKILDGGNFVFSDESTPIHVIHLMNKVRKDADNFILNDSIDGDLQTINEDLTSYQIEFAKFIDKPDLKKNRIVEGWKIDLNSAYWQCALNMGIISEETDKYLTEIDFGYDKYGNRRNDKILRKAARLKGFGALATRKIRDLYVNGVLIPEEMQAIFDKLHRAIYLNVCQQISNVMCEISLEFFDNVISYYWDCVFIDNKIDKEIVIQRINDLGYDCKLEGEKTSFEINREKNSASIKDKSSGKSYNINPNEIIY